MNTADLPPVAFGRRDSVLDCGAARRFAAHPMFKPTSDIPPKPVGRPSISRTFQANLPPHAQPSGAQRRSPRRSRANQRQKTLLPKNPDYGWTLQHSEFRVYAVPAYCISPAPYRLKPELRTLQRFPDQNLRPLSKRVIWNLELGAYSAFAKLRRDKLGFGAWDLELLPPKPSLTA